MDFVTGLSESEAYDAIMVIVDRLTKMRHFIPCNTTVNSEDFTQLYLRNIWKLHGLPTHVTSDCGTQFTARFWKALCKHFGIEARMSTTFHPETDSQTERLNAVMEQYLHEYVSYQQDDWVK
jgi:transposase InsO family protein